MQRRRIALIQTILPHYRIPLFYRLSNRKELSLTLFYGKTKMHGSSGIQADFQDGARVRNLEIHLPWITLTIQLGLIERVLRGNFDAIICEGSISTTTCALLAAISRLKHIKIIWWTKVFSQPHTPKILAHINLWNYKILDKLCDAFLVYGETSKRLLESLDVDPSKIFVAQNTLDISDAAAKAPHYRRQGLQWLQDNKLSNTRIILYVGRLTKTKRVQDLLVAFKKVQSIIHNATLLIVGEGPERRNLMMLCNKLRLRNAQFVEQVSPGEELKFFAVADVIVIPGEAGLALNQGLAFGKPIVCAYQDGPDAELILHGKTGLFFRFGNIEDMAKMVLVCLRMPELAASLAQSGKRLIFEKATPDIMVESFLDAVNYVSGLK